MKYISCYGFLLACLSVLVFNSCSYTDDDVATDAMAYAEYIIDNQSGATLIYFGASEIEIMPSESKTINSEVLLGISTPASPSIGLESLILFRDDNGSLVTAFEMDPVTDDPWTEENISDNESKFTLSITAEMIE
ncbi:hypothetical protein [Salegentibacter chungangensis]|uniref:Uncharacterized protein n=1 Tax=Salegentibacter chungangensis TaxID=1335724 RepID=A0ABW3NSZ9_9FLAO